MGGSNLPPGVSEGMIPGNRSEDLAEEEFWATLDENFNNEYPVLASILQVIWDSEDQNTIDAVQEYVEMARDLGYRRGFSEGSSEADMVISMVESEVDEVMRDWHYNNQHVSATAYLIKMAEVRREIGERLKEKP